jgi:phenylalanyl-tRNA synthetase beta subunit
MFLNNSSAFETVQGILDLLMTKIGAKFGKDYALRESEDPIFFPKRGAEILLSG